MTIAPDPLHKENSAQALSPHEALYGAIEMRYSDLWTGVQVLVAKSGLVDGEVKIAETADDLLHDMLETALKIADRLDPTRSAYSWLMGIAVKKISEMARTIKREGKRIQIVADKDDEDDGASARRGKDDSESLTAEEVIDAMFYQTSNRSLLEEQEPLLNEMLALVKDSDREILMLAIVDGLSGADLAASLGIREGAAYVRLTRAKEHLRQKYLAIHDGKGL